MHQRLLKVLQRSNKAVEVSGQSFIHTWAGLSLEQSASLVSAGDKDLLSEGLVLVPKARCKVLLNGSQPWLEHAASLGWAERWSISLKCRNSSRSWHCHLAQKQKNRRQSDWWLFEEASAPTEFILELFFSTLEKKNEVGCVRPELCSAGLCCLLACSSCTLHSTSGPEDTLNWCCDWGRWPACPYFPHSPSLSQNMW